MTTVFIIILGVAVLAGGWLFKIITDPYSENQ